MASPRTARGGTPNRFIPWGLGAIGFLLVALIWYGVSVSNLFRSGLVPTPFAVAETLYDAYRAGTLTGHILASVRRILIGVVVGVAAAVPVGFLLGWYRPIRALIDPLINFFRALPPIALIPLVIVYFGIGESARISVLIYASFFAAVVVIYEGIISIEDLYVRAAQTLGATPFEIFSKVVLPLSVPHILVAFRVALGVSWATVVAAELIAAQDGLGAYIQNASNFFQIPAVYGGIILIGAAALIMDRLIRLLTARLIRWQGRMDR